MKVLKAVRDLAHTTLVVCFALLVLFFTIGLVQVLTNPQEFGLGP